VIFDVQIQILAEYYTVWWYQYIDR